MKLTGKTAAAGLSILLCSTALFGCGSQKKEIEEATKVADSFMEALKDENINEISTYATEDVTNGAFVELFDSNYLKTELITSLGNPGLDDETVAKLDSFYAHYASMIDDYSITEVTLNEDETATAYVTLDNAFPYDVITGEATEERFTQASETYKEEHADEIATLTSEQGEDVATEKVCNDLIGIAIDIYEDSINRAQPITYMIALTLSKDGKGEPWLVTSVQSYDSSIAGTGEPATETDTSTTEAALPADATETLFEEISDN